MVTRAVAGGQSSKIDEHDKSSGSDIGLNDSTRQLTDLRIQCIEFLLGASAAPRTATRTALRKNLVKYSYPYGVFLKPLTKLYCRSRVVKR